jgi:hypothetical protein
MLQILSYMFKKVNPRDVSCKAIAFPAGVPWTDARAYRSASIGTGKRGQDRLTYLPGQMRQL